MLASRVGDCRRGICRWVLAFGLLLVGLSERVVAQAAEDLRLLPPIESIVAPPAVPDASTDPGIFDLQGEPDPAGVLGVAVLDGAVYPAWANPFHWFDGPLWDGSLEAGLNGSRGNNDALSFRVGGNLKRETDVNTLEVLINYGRNEQGGVETQNNGLLSGRWDWNLPSPSWILFHRGQLEYDEFKAFDVRLSTSLGLGYHFLDTESTKLTSRFGASVSHEFGGPDDSWVPEADFGFDASHQLSKRQSLKASVDYYPALESFRDYRFVSQAHWQVLLDEETNLSLKFGAIDRYDNSPNGRRPNDIDYYLTLVWKL